MNRSGSAWNLLDDSKLVLLPFAIKMEDARDEWQGI
jgi:hypothetical protein